LSREMNQTSDSMPSTWPDYEDEAFIRAKAKMAANLIMNNIKSFANKHKIKMREAIEPGVASEIIDMYFAGEISKGDVRKLIELGMQRSLENRAAQ